MRKLIVLMLTSTVHRRDLPEPIALSFLSTRQFPPGVHVQIYKPDNTERA